MQVCGELIGYEVLVYADPNPLSTKALVHAVCLEALVERGDKECW